MSTQTIDQTLCRRCGLCAQVCSAGVYEMTDDGPEVLEERAGACIECGHCMAICPTKAVSVPGLDYEEFAPLPEPVTSPEELSALMLRRRSIRAFEDTPVPRELLERIVAAAAAAPMSFPPTDVEVTILTRREDVAKILPVAVQQTEQLMTMTRSVIGRWVLRRMTGDKTFRLLKDVLLPVMAPAVEEHRRSGLDFATWGAPALLVFHVGPTSLMGETDGAIAATHAMLMAEALGLGTILLGFAAAALQQSPPLRQELQIPPDCEVLSVLAVGYTNRKFLRTIPRELRSVNWV